MPLAPGTRLGPYEVLRPIGSGGMGEVYAARDTRLERTVALKLSKQAFEQRFRNEALAVAKLNHPHIAALYDVGPDYLVMELVEGRPLRGPVPFDEALRLAGQIADALEHAHARGIVHRDLKPANILVTKAGAKVLDFGIAKRLEARPMGEESHTTLTEDGSAGTPRYMAPEQLDGKAADARTDVFAFGLVLHELLTGQHAFAGTSGARVMAAILEKDPTPILQVKPDTPPALERVVATCLAKDPSERWQSMRELKHALTWAAERPLEQKPAKRLGRWWSPGIVALGLGVVLAVTLGILASRRFLTSSRPQPVELQVLLPENTRLNWLEKVEVSPDGKRMALALIKGDAHPRLYLRSLDSVAVVPVAGAEEGMSPSWSPDGRRLLFFSPGGLLKKVDLSGGPATTLCRVEGTLRGATWSRDGVVVFSASGRLHRVADDGGEPSSLGTLVAGEIARVWPYFLPDGRHYVYLSLAARHEDQGIYVGILGGDLRRRLVATDHGAEYSASGHLLYVKDGTLLAHPFDPRRLELVGAPVAVVDQVTRLTGTTTGGLAHFSTSANGVLAWRTGTPAQTVQLTWFDKSGRRLGVLGEPSHWIWPALSPDGGSVAVCRLEGDTNADRNLWILDAATGAARRLTFDPHDDCATVWSPDGTAIAFYSDRRGVREIYRRRVDGASDDELLLASRDFPLHVEDWSRDGRYLVYSSPRPNQFQDIFLLPLTTAGTRDPLPLLATRVLEREGALSPNGSWLAYVSNESPGPWEVYVREVTALGTAGPGKWQVSTGGGRQPRWRADGRELYFTAASGLMAVEVRPERSTFAAGPQRALGVPPGSLGYSVSRDGQRFLVAVSVDAPEPIRVLVNWLPPGP